MTVSQYGAATASGRTKLSHKSTANIYSMFRSQGHGLMKSFSVKGNCSTGIKYHLVHQVLFGFLNVLWEQFAEYKTVFLINGHQKRVVFSAAAAGRDLKSGVVSIPTPEESWFWFLSQVFQSQTILQTIRSVKKSQKMSSQKNPIETFDGKIFWKIFL